MENEPLYLLSHEGIELLTPDQEGLTVLSWAAQQGWTEIVKETMDTGSRVDAVDELCQTALSYAAQFGQIRIIKMLLSYQVSPAIADVQKLTHLFYAAFNDSFATIETLLKDQRTTVKWRDLQGRSALHCAAEEGQSKAVEALLKENRGLMIDKVTKFGMTPLLSALVREHRDTAEVLIRNHARWQTEVEEQRPWRWAINCGHWACAEFILEKFERADGETEKMAISIELSAGSSEALGNPGREGRRWGSLTQKGGLFLRRIGDDEEIASELAVELGEKPLRKELQVEVSEVSEVDCETDELKVASIP
ncbi:hypothetical protein PWT90_06631 [Aphanocladium album]|nr:hypothetical protein PWT90_06631 [Aphanocladium album]